jgi:hypothetical protein
MIFAVNPSEAGAADPLYSLVYMSIAVAPMTARQLLELRDQSRDKNAKMGITGMLLYKGDHFMQVLEGPKAAVLGLLASIRTDHRHTSLLILEEGPMETRHFPNWAMGFENLDSAEVGRLPGYQEFAGVPFTVSEFRANPNRAQRLLSLFWYKL